VARAEGRIEIRFTGPGQELAMDVEDRYRGWPRWATA
jgi:hypothetical protein